LISKSLFNRLWTQAVGTPGYKKADWLALEQQIDEANRQAAHSATGRAS
jgi:hypothetical protein